MVLGIALAVLVSWECVATSSMAGSVLDGARGATNSPGQRVQIVAEPPVTARLEEVLTVITAHSLRGAPSSQELARGLRDFVRSIDHYGDYLRPEVLLSVEARNSDAYSGVGLDVFWDRDGRFVCLPVPGGPAMEAGVGYGHELLAVGGHDARLLGLEDIGYLLRGDPGTTAVIKVRSQPTGDAREVYLKRRMIGTVSLSRINAGSVPGVRISKFTERTPQELASMLQDMDLSKGLVIDIRGNPGGDFHGAVKAAGLFLDAGAIICIQKTRTGDKTFRSDKRVLRPRRIYVWQDHITASAAEVFLAAIVENRVGIGIGLPSFGKGVSQKLFKLSRGGAVLLSNAELLTPSGRRYDGIGLAPSYQVPPDMSWSDMTYRNLTRDIMQGKGQSVPVGSP